MKRIVRFHYFNNPGIGGMLVKVRLGTTISHVGMEFGKRFFHSAPVVGMVETSLHTLQSSPFFTQEIEVDEETYQDTIRWCEKQIGRKYDMKAILGFILARRMQNKDAFFCSEVGRHVFTRLTGIKPAMSKLMAPHELRLAIDIYNQTKTQGR